MAFVDLRTLGFGKLLSLMLVALNLYHIVLSMIILIIRRGGMTALQLSQATFLENMSSPVPGQTVGTRII